MSDCMKMPPCEKCGGVTERDYHVEHTGHIPGGAWPIVTTHLDGTPREVTSEAHMKQLCKQFGKVHRPDAAFVEKVSVVNRKTGRVEYREGSGDGDSPGRRWV
jgi:hypothetical protein